MAVSKDECLSPDEQLLRDLISDVSQVCYAAGWMADAEFNVWRLATEGGNWGWVAASAVRTQLDQALGLASAIGRWVVWSEESGCQHEAIDMLDWKARYATWRRDIFPVTSALDELP
jgi:hypothetical protein